MKAIAALILLIPFFGEPTGFIVAVPVAAAVFAVFLPGRHHRFTLIVIGVCLLSLLADAVYQGPKVYVLLGAAVEVPVLLVLTARTVRRTTAYAAALAVLTTTLLPVRFLSTDPVARSQAVADTCVLVLLLALTATGIGLRLRLLDNRQKAAVRKALHAQRLDVAADLHDYVAHELTGIVLEVQAAQFNAYEPDQVKELLERLEAAGLRALESMDRTVGALRDTAPTRVFGLADLPEVVGRFSADAELTCEPTLAGTFPNVVEDTAYRVVLESLTNVRRHAAGSENVKVDVVRGPEGALELTVTDQGGTELLADERTDGGTGLAGLRARIEALGGTLTWGPHGRGWRTRAVFPH